MNHSERKAWRGGTFSGLHHRLGAHPMDGGHGVRYAVWAPHAVRVGVAGDFNGWEAGRNLLEKDPESGIWQGVAGEAAPGDRYKYAIWPDGGEGGKDDATDAFLKSDPLAFRTEPPPRTASVVPGLEDWAWDDGEWMRGRAGHAAEDAPVAIYEMHLGSWRPPGEGGQVTYREAGEALARYVSELGFTHVELLPLAEHPYGASWGYQVTGFFAPTARYGPPQGLKALVEACHRRGLGVIMDWVPGHFPKDEHGLRQFDGTPLYEHPDPRRSEHPDWGTLNFDLDKGPVRSFLLSCASWWCSEYHLDGLRVDAVASMLYLDYSRDKKEWLPNVYGGKKNLGAVAFLQDLHRMLREEHPDVITVAEESTSWPGVTRPPGEGGLGFDYKWNMGWMNDTLHYASLDSGERGEVSHGITFPATYAFKERYVLPFSHDEVVHMKGSLWERMPGGPAEKLRNLRLLYLYWMTCPGKKLLFMGSEWGQRSEWSEGHFLAWEEVRELPGHRALQEYLRRLLRFYLSSPALHAEPSGWEGFAWEDLTGREKGRFSFRRRDPRSGQNLHGFFNFGPDPWRLGSGDAKKYGAPLIFSREYDTELVSDDGSPRLPPCSGALWEG
ncbi:MAG: 1,4-alpha-glucan branching protein GlgB [Balneolaceae bacterium]|nr:1,4-alpha-glucan branching protein GlgB [Balneolaceae bacterium]